MNDPAYADYSDGADELLPSWFDTDFIEAVIAVGATLPGRRHTTTTQGTTTPAKTPCSKITALADRLRREKS